ncbi:hypothetical protein [Paracoccus tegillarcae]|uniref:Uncharacterized protein n=1 Tax=Paracoccus tegillarcae TaxID=1529068 RepID=A0A2K9EHW2_9RHOB|nr:hypothetical protein [Paracoccus tegillarcae]AUH34588.1 hypothetical protein CUV01_15435 [Paracoccus tegillarcae]
MAQAPRRVNGQKPAPRREIINLGRKQDAETQEVGAASDYCRIFELTAVVSHGGISALIRAENAMVGTYDIAACRHDLEARDNPSDWHALPAPFPIWQRHDQTVA